MLFKKIKTYTFLTFLVVFGALVFGYFSFQAPISKAAAGDVPLAGWAWSDNIGWISFSSTTDNSSINYGVTKLPSGSWSGWAWSNNIGWIKFDPSLTGPSGNGTAYGVRVNGDNTITGWARACGGSINGDCTGGDRTDGWDGWISFTDAQAVDTGTYIKYSGYAWGSDVIGWIDLYPVSPSGSNDSATCCGVRELPPGVTLNPLFVSCSSPSPSTKPVLSAPPNPSVTVTWTAVVNQATPMQPYQYSWDGGNTWSSNTTFSRTYTTSGSKADAPSLVVRDSSVPPQSTPSSGSCTNVDVHTTTADVITIRVYDSRYKNDRADQIGSSDTPNIAPLARVRKGIPFDLIGTMDTSKFDTYSITPDKVGQTIDTTIVNGTQSVTQNLPLVKYTILGTKPDNTTLRASVRVQAVDPNLEEK